jgi:hypothetical protein
MRGIGPLTVSNSEISEMKPLSPALQASHDAEDVAPAAPSPLARAAQVGTIDTAPMIAPVPLSTRLYSKQGLPKGAGRPPL